MKVTDRTVALALCFFGAIDVTSIAAAAMPYTWMQAINAWFGFGTLPDLPIVEYLARHVSLWYAAHAATLLFLATDVPRFHPAIRFIAWLGLAFMFGLVAIDVASGLPLSWTINEFLGGSFEAVVLLILLRLAGRNSALSEGSGRE